jgi:hypothetical protein
MPVEESSSKSARSDISTNRGAQYSTPLKMLD